MKKTTRELLQFALKRFGYQSKPISFGDYVITYDLSVPTIKKQGKGVGVAVEGQIYINDLLERFLFGRAVEKNFRAIVAFIDDYILKTFQEKMAVK